MIINNTYSKIKLLLDENDFKKLNIPIKEFISNPNKFIDTILLNTSSKITYKFLNYQNINIYTNNFKIYCIEIYYG